MIELRWYERDPVPYGEPARILQYRDGRYMFTERSPHEVWIGGDWQDIPVAVAENHCKVCGSMEPHYCGGGPMAHPMRRALESEEFYELSQAYRHAKDHLPRSATEKDPVSVAWEKLKQYIIDNSA